MIEDMTIRKFAPKTQHDYVQRIKNFAVFLGRSPDTATFEDVRRYQLHLAASGVSVPTINQTVRRFLIHVLPKGLHRIRHYGLFAKGACAGNIARARELLAVAKPEGQPTAAAVDPSKPACPCCGGRMIIVEVFARGAMPRYRPTAPTNHIRIDTS
ncbi:phage integrase N-terminal SAM-like domain-containing protein [Bradyrhizobium sp. BRP22]|uniref:phage integrase N-terminal SAM-like domain-containing protein n=1 Tax=Bradyrhizobium sp. BRP22 TaxID=2793821 RepID=UPI001CD40288|nr:phage integrase N-terminal SAM-like domain-containing protein [Bradyrhizobium sp. BRP22]